MMSTQTTTALLRGESRHDDELIITTRWFDNDGEEKHPAMIQRIEAYGAFHTIEMMKRANENGGYHFFSRDAMRFFRSRIAPGVVHGRVFITSEQFDYASPRLYTVRAMRDDGSTVELSEFQQFDTLRQARAYVRRIYT
jgi:hypothetical protein